MVHALEITSSSHRGVPYPYNPYLLKSHFIVDAADAS